MRPVARDTAPAVASSVTGSVIQQWWLGYNFSVAVWVGYIALYGVAVQTGVVMVLYLHEALDKRLAKTVKSRKPMYSKPRFQDRCSDSGPSR